MKDYIPLNLKKQWRIKTRVKYANRRAKRFGAVGRFTKETVAKLYERQHGRCACCGVLLEFYFQIDHIKPLSKGGNNAPENLQLLKPFCNQLKADMPMEDYLSRR